MAEVSRAGLAFGGHVSLHEAGALARSVCAPAVATGAPLAPPAALPARAPASAPSRLPAPPADRGARAFTPHTPIRSAAAGPADPDRWDAMLNRIGRACNVPPLFLKAVMLSESGGRPDAVGDGGHSVGLFQLHDQGYGAGMGDRRFDPEVNAERGARGLAEAWHAGVQKGLSGEEAVRAAYDYSFNPGGGWAYQGDSVVRHYNQLLREQGLPPLA